jgi:hypothetical protein
MTVRKMGAGHLEPDSLLHLAVFGTELQYQCSQAPHFVPSPDFCRLNRLLDTYPRSEYVPSPNTMYLISSTGTPFSARIQCIFCSMRLAENALMRPEFLIMLA